MRDPIPKQFTGGQGFRGPKQASGQFTGNFSQQSAQGGGNNQTQGKKWPDYCWTFNKGFCKDGNKCHFVNRCSYCDSTNHGICACPRAKKVGVTIISQNQMGGATAANKS